MQVAAETGSRQSPREVARKRRRMGAYYAADRDNSSARKHELGRGQHHTRRLEANLLDDGRVDTLVEVKAKRGHDQEAAEPPKRQAHAVLLCGRSKSR